MLIDLQSPILQLILATVCGGAGLSLLLPGPRRRHTAIGVFFIIVAFSMITVFAVHHFGSAVKLRDGTADFVGTCLFWFFTTCATIAAIIQTTQRNPARSAIAFAFAILSICGLFLLLAAPFLMAATIVVYAGAIIVTFLFVLMLSPVRKASDENDRSREPLLGSFAGFAMTSLILFTIQQSFDTHSPSNQVPIPSLVFSEQDRVVIEQSYHQLDHALLQTETSDEQELMTVARKIELDLNELTHRFDLDHPSTGSIAVSDPRTESFHRQWKSLETAHRRLEECLEKRAVDLRSACRAVRNELALLRGTTDLPARNVANLGMILYSEQLLAVEMAGTVLLAATVGAVALVLRRKEVYR